MEIEVHAGWGNTDKIAVAGRSDTAVKESSLEPVRPTYDWSEAKFGDQDLDFGEVKDQQRVKRAVESPPPGGHNILSPLDLCSRVGYVENARVDGLPAGPERLVDANTSMNAPVALS